jgi:hypothetical protein
LANGDVEYLGRIDQQVKLRGFRIELGEIEAALCQHSAIRQAVVVLCEMDGDRRLAAYLVPTEPRPSAADLRLFLSKRLPEYMLPSVFLFLDAVPLTPNGKVDRRALHAPGAWNVGARTEHVASRTQTEKDLTGIWKESLSVERLGIHDDFFDIGGHSLSAMRVVARIQRSHGLDVSVASVFLYPTIELLAAEIDRMRISMQSEEDLLRILDEIDDIPALNSEGE